jgi:hypothetical protein
MRVRLETRWTKEKGRKKTVCISPRWYNWLSRSDGVSKVGGSDLGNTQDHHRFRSISIVNAAWLVPSFFPLYLSVSIKWNIDPEGPRTKTQSKRDWPNKSNTQSHSPSPFREKSGTMTLYSRQFSWRFIINKTRGERRERKERKKKSKKRQYYLLTFGRCGQDMICNGRNEWHRDLAESSLLSR